MAPSTASMEPTSGWGSSCSSGSSNSGEGGDCAQGAGQHEQEACSCQEPAPQTLYDVLGVSIMATSEAIRSAYRRLARLWHPDRHRGDEQAKCKFQELQRAYEVLSDMSRRHQYDLNLLEFLDVEEYLARYQGLILTASGLGMSSRESSTSSSLSSNCMADPFIVEPTKPARTWFLLKAS